MSVYRKHGGQWGYKGHVLNLPQDIHGFLQTLPRSVADLPILIIRRAGTDNTYFDFHVRRDKILTALQWLKANNPCYRDITIDHDILQSLPQNGIPTELMTVEEEALSCEQQDMHSSEEHNGCDSHSFLPLPNKQSTDDMAIRNTILGDTLDPLNWPDINNVPINEFQTPYLATMSFPTLFPYATGDPTYPGRQRPVSLTDGFKHLIKYGDISDSNIKSWRFASHPHFIYWALNMKQRHQLLSQAKIYLLQNPGDANLSVDDLKAMVGTTSADYLMKRLQRYAAKIQGSNGYWFQRYQELQARMLLAQMISLSIKYLLYKNAIIIV